MLKGMELKLDSKFKIHGGQRAHKIVPKDNISLDFLGQDNKLVTSVFAGVVLNLFFQLRDLRNLWQDPSLTGMLIQSSSEKKS